MKTMSLTLVLVAAAVAVPAAAAPSPPVGVTGASGVVHPGERAFVQVRTRARLCRLEVRRAATLAAGRTVRLRAREVRFEWRVPTQAAPGIYRVSVRCATTRSRVARGRSATAALTVERIGPGRARILVVDPARARARHVAASADRGEPQFVEGIAPGEGDPAAVSVDVAEGIGGSPGFSTYFPLQTGLQARITQGPGGPYSHRRASTQNAVDFGLPSGTEVRAGFRGVVARTQTGCGVGNRDCGGGFGNYVLLKATDGTCALHAHLSQVTVGPGQQVPRYTLLGRVGSTGWSTGAHLHYDRIDCGAWRSLPWGVAEGVGLGEGSVVTSRNAPEPAPVLGTPPKATEPVTGTPAPTIPSQPHVPSPVTRTITVNNTVIWSVPPGYREDSQPAPILPAPHLWRLSDSIARYNSGVQLKGVCHATGPRITDGNDSWAGDDPWQYASTLVYGVTLPDGRRGYIHSAWSTKRHDGLGLPAC